MSSSNYRGIPTSQHPLRKQISLVVDSSASTRTRATLSATGLGPSRNYAVLSTSRRTDRLKCVQFQKQFSVDQVLSASRSVRQKSGLGLVQRRSVSRTPSSASFGKTVVANSYPPANNNQQCSVGEDTSGPTNASSNLKIVPTVKKRVQPSKGHVDSRKDKIAAERTRKSSRVTDDRYNLKIFLDQNICRQDSNDIGSVGSLSSSDEDTESEEINELETKEPAPLPDQHPTDLKSKPPLQPQLQPSRLQISASTRRAQFKAGRQTDASTAALTLASNLSLTVERRPPLVRAMSAPIRLHDDSTKNVLASKRKIRRRKISARTPSVTGSSANFDNAIIENKTSTIIESPGDQSRDKIPKKPINRTRSTLGCDVVTLVSLISSEGSESEREETSLTTIDTNRFKRPPLLRKSGKSVSFQEEELDTLANAAKEFPHMLRRGSIAPLAARIRANRPPTAPPGSIFMHGFEGSDSKMSKSMSPEKSSKDDTAILGRSTQGNAKENVPENGNSTANDNSQYPEYVRSLKERECWKLFQKMLNKGVTVSYDTVLRGMLTPTELRLLQKQKEMEEARKVKESEEVTDKKDV